MQVSTNPGTVGEQPNASKHAGQAQQVQGKNLAAAKESSASTSHSGASNQTSEYLKVLSRMEGMLAEGTVPEVALTGFAGAIRKRLEALSDSQKAALMKMPEVKALDVETLEKLPETIKAKLQEAETRPVVMKLLKHPKFSNLMRDEPTSATYSPKTMSVAPPKVQQPPTVTVNPPPVSPGTTAPQVVSSSRAASANSVAAKPIGAASKMTT